MKWTVRYALVYIAIFTAGYALALDGWWSWAVWLICVGVGAWLAAPIRDALASLDLDRGRAEREAL